NSLPEGSHISPIDRSGGVIQKQDCRVECERAAEPDTDTGSCVEMRDWSAPRQLGDADFAGQVGGSTRHVSGWRLDIERGRYAEILDDAQSLEENGAIADNPEWAHDGQPLRAIHDGGRRPSEHSHFAMIWQCGAGGQVDEHLGHRLIQTEDRQMLT